jgi:hypothetical protein
LEWDKAQARLRQRENQYRLAQGLPPLGEGEEVPERESGDEPDPLLEESARITADFITLLNQKNGSRGMAWTGR